MDDQPWKQFPDEASADALEHDHAAVTTETEGASGTGTHEAGETEEGTGAEGVFATLRHKMLRVSTMTPSLRLFTGLAAGELLAVVILVALHPLLGAQMPVGTSDHQATQMPVAVFVAAVLFLWVAWSLLLGGAMTGHWILRAPILAVFTYLLLAPPVPTLAGTARLVLLVALWGWAFLATLVPWAARRSRSKHARAAAVLRRVEPWFGFARTVPLLAAGVGGYILVLLASVNWGQGNTVFADYITVHLEEMTFFLSPVLFLAGADFVELSEVVSNRVASVARAPRQPWLLVAATTGFALYIVGTNLFQGASLPATLTSIGTQVVLAAVVLVALVAIVRWAGVGRWRHALVPFMALLLVTVGVMGGFIAYISYDTAHLPPPSLLGPDDYAIFQHANGTPNFSFAYPKTWKPLPAATGTTPGVASELFDGTKSPYPAVMYVLTASTAVVDENQMLAQASGSFCQPGCVGAPHTSTQGPWHVETLSTSTHTAGIWTQTQGNQATIVMIEASPEMYPLLAPTFADIAGTWRLDLRATAPVSEATVDAAANARALALSLALPALVGLLVGLGLLARFRARGGRWAMAGLFATVFGVVLLALDLQRLVGAAGLPSGQLGFTLTSVQLALALGTLGVVGWLLVRRGLRSRRWTASDREALGLLLALALGVQAILWFVALFDASMAVTLSVAQAIILIIGMSWDLLMSGEEITNVEGRAFPRHARVLLYLGYMALVGTAVLYFSTQTSAAPGHKAIEPFFDDDSWPQQGLLYLGVPLLITSFLVEASRWWHARLEHRKAHVHAHADAVVYAASVTASLPQTDAEPGMRHEER